jgi:triacylglycerol lipase
VSSTSRSPRFFGSLALIGATVAGSIAMSATPAAALPPSTAGSALAKRVEPVLMVHGFTRTSADFSTLIAEYKKQGYPDSKIFTLDYNSFAPNAYTATLVAAKVQAILAQTGAKKVDIVAHSMGAYSTRYFIKNLGGDKLVESFVSLAGPNHGTTAVTDSAD